MRGASRRMRLTDAGVRRLRPGNREYMVWDSRIAGLAVRVRQSGHRSFVWHGHANGAAVRVTLGATALKSVEEARRESLALQNEIGLTSTGDRKNRCAIPQFRDFAIGEWKAAFENRWGLSRRRTVDHTLTTRLLPAFGTVRLDRIRRSDVERWFDAYSATSPGAANQALSLLRQILNVAAATGHITGNPTQGIKKNLRRKMTRFLSTNEIVRLHHALDRLVGERPSRRPQADIIRLLLPTGCRRGEILKLKWSEVDGDVLRYPGRVRRGCAVGCRGLLERLRSGRIPSGTDDGRDRHCRATSHGHCDVDAAGDADRRARGGRSDANERAYT